MSYSAHAVQWEGKGDNNRGLIYGIEYMDGDEVADVEWFKSARIRDGNLKLYLDDLKTWDKTFNADESMSPAEFAKLMGAYPEPAGNPSPAYGGYMDNSAANFAWVNNNDYFGAEVHLDGSPRIHGHTKCDCDRCERGREGHYPNGWTCQDTGVVYRYKDADTDLTPTNHMNNSIGQVVPITNPMELPTNLIETEAGGGSEGQITPDVFSAENECDTCQKDKPIVAHVEFDGPFLSALCKECYAEHLEMGGKPNVYGAESFEARNRFMGDGCGNCKTQGRYGVEYHCIFCDSAICGDCYRFTPYNTCRDCFKAGRKESIPQTHMSAESFNAESENLSECCGESMSQRTAPICSACGKVDYYIGLDGGGYGKFTASECCGKPQERKAVLTCDKCNKIDYGAETFEATPKWECDFCGDDKMLFEMQDNAANEILCKPCIKRGHDSHWNIKTHLPETFPADSLGGKTPKEIDIRDNLWWSGAESFNAELGFKCKFCGSTAEGRDTWDDDYCSIACEKGIKVCGISDGKGQNGKYGEFCDIRYAGKSDADDNKIIIHISCPNCDFSEDGWGDSLAEEMRQGYRAESFNAESNKTYDIGGFLGVFSQCPNTECKSEGGDTSLGVAMDKKTYKPVRVYMECVICDNDFEATKDDAMGVLYWWNSDYDEYESVRKYLIDKYGEPPSKEDIDEIYSRLGLREAESHDFSQKSAESFEAFNIGYDDTTNQIHIENKCDGCGKDFLLTENPNLVGGNRAGAIVYEVLNDGEISYPEHSPYGDLLCKACWKINKEDSFNADWIPPEKLLPQLKSALRAAMEALDDCETGGGIEESEITGLYAMHPIIKRYYGAEMDIVADGMAVVSNIRDEVVGAVEVIDSDDDDEMVEISIQDENLEEIGSFTLDDGMILDDEDNYLAESKTPSLLTLGIGVVAAIFAFPYLKDGVSKVFGADNDVQENEPELIENPDMGDLDPAAYEELVVESTGYALDIIPMGLDGSFMGSRFAALPTERYVDYNDPGIGAHTDIALNRDETFLEPEMAMVQAAEGETVVKETQAPGQSPYFQMGQEPVDMNYRVIKETHPVSLDPAVKSFIPQSMTGYTGNKNTPPSVYNKMFNIGVLGQTPLFTPQDAEDIGASRAGSRRAKPNILGLNGSVGGPLSDKVNANYTDGTTSMSLAQWAQENTVSQSSDTEAVVIDRSSGAMKRVRRV